MRTVSPFPYKVELIDPNQRIKWGDVDQNLVDWCSKYTGTYASNPLIKSYKKDIVNNWCNMMFGSTEWDFEDNNPQPDVDDAEPLRYWLCFKTEENATLTALKWN